MTTPLTGNMIPFGISDLVVTPMLTDPLGGSATYGTPIDVPGIKNMSFAPVFVNKQQTGPDATIIGAQSKVTALKSNVVAGALSQAVIAALLGSTLTASGSSPNRQSKLSLNAADRTGFFKIEGQSTYDSANPGGDVHRVVYKCLVEDLKIGDAKDLDAVDVTFSVQAFPRLSDGALADIDQNETQTNITSGAPVAPTVLSVTPANGATGVADSPATVVVVMSEALNTATVTSSTVAVSVSGVPQTGTRAVSTTNVTNDTITYTYSGGSWVSGSTYSCALTTGLQSASGVALATGVTSTFTAAS